MALTNLGYGRTVTSCEGMEVDLSAARPHELPDSLGIEATPGEFYPTCTPQPVKAPEKELAHDRIPPGSPSSLKPKRFLPLLVAAIIVAVIVLALAIPLALRLKKPFNPSSPVNSKSTARVQDELPTSGAFNGTGLAFIALDLTDVPDVSLFYQDYDARIRRLHSIELSPCVGGFPIVASNARNTTPLTTLTYPASNGELNLGQDGNSPGIRLYYGAPDNKVHELALFPNISSQYFSHSVIPGTNGNAGIASGWSDDSGLGNLYVFDKNNEFQIWSNNFNTTHDATQNASYDNWIEGGL
ncbi:hypothetical protein HO133_008349 [Letharia lupina]|uniref:Fucose-specific lectin n=1 Tax=Letharia lupina TaxID=560253 RepID=A0A8H6FGD9_9LECA|nr:uncharacterized protein HO133_008349 [Letharia lupina]KAF6226908.1 hypothetical protein HO133_008349 [Letharia lupina]